MSVNELSIFDSAIILMERIPGLVIEDSQSSFLQLELLIRDLTYLLSNGFLEATLWKKPLIHCTPAFKRLQELLLRKSKPFP